MKTRILALLLVLGAVISNESFASRARTTVLGTGQVNGMVDEGSFIYEDAYNMFYNPAYVNDYKDWIIFEKSNFPGTTSMGGFTTGIGPVAFGAFFNRVSGVNPLVDGTNTFSNFPFWGNAANASLTRTNMKPIDLMVGMDMGSFKWGFGVNYASLRDQVTVRGNAKTLTLRGGITIMNWEPYIDWTPSGEIQDDTFAGVSATFPGSSVKYNVRHIGGGVRYHYGDWVPYLALRSDKIDVRKTTSWGFGLGRSMKFGDSGVGINYALSFWRSNVNPVGGAAATAGGRRTSVPIDLSIEGDASDWLTVRAGTHYRLIDRMNGNDQADTTTGRVGGTFHLKKVDLNFAVGTGTVTAEAAGTTTGQSYGFSDNFFSVASVEYRW